MTMVGPDAPSSVPIDQPKPFRINYARIHAKRLPLDTFPLPPLIPHNPFSLLQIAYIYLSHLLSPPSSHAATRVHGHFSPETNSVHVTDEASIRWLWERGFFGKGSLSRSEPTWLEREKKRFGLLATDTSEEYTQQRREERRRMKNERARKEREAIEEKLAHEGRNGLTESLFTTLDGHQRDLPNGSHGHEEPEISVLEGKPYSTLQEIEKQIDEGLAAARNALDQINSAGFDQQTQNANVPPVEVANQEHLQLTAQEAFFLTYGLGVLDVHAGSSNQPITVPGLLTLLRSHSHFPPLEPSALTSYDPFLPSYAVYHHFRSLGWVVRPGIKFAVDWLLYLRGPPFAHAEFAVVVLPAFNDRYWWTDSMRQKTLTREKKDWWWLHCLQRVQAQVRKGLVICWVEIPRPTGATAGGMSDADKEVAEYKGVVAEGLDIGRMLKQYKVRDMMIKRWIPNRSRD